VATIGDRVRLDMLIKKLRQSLIPIRPETDVPATNTLKPTPTGFSSRSNSTKGVPFSLDIRKAHAHLGSQISLVSDEISPLVASSNANIMSMDFVKQVCSCFIFLI
jgi:hypothetical protein